MWNARVSTADRVVAPVGDNDLALRIEIETPHTYKESGDLFRIGSAEVNANPDGIDFSGPMFETLALTGMFTREIAMDQSSMAYQSARRCVRKCRHRHGIYLVGDSDQHA